MKEFHLQKNFVTADTITSIIFDGNILYNIDLLQCQHSKYPKKTLMFPVLQYPTLKNAYFSKLSAREKYKWIYRYREKYYNKYYHQQYQKIETKFNIMLRMKLSSVRGTIASRKSPSNKSDFNTFSKFHLEIQLLSPMARSM